MTRGTILARAIPTCVGTTLGFPSPQLARSGHPHVCGDYAGVAFVKWVPSGHPHVCGDYLFCLANSATLAGPSPRVWGLHTGQAKEETPGRAIPTCVGTTVWLRGFTWAQSGHPHVCGDYAPAASFTACQTGPSPRVWGLPHLLPRGSPQGRAIPTCVGTTGTWACLTCRATGHPHVCGDYERLRQVQDGVGGPSPRVWGLPGCSSGESPARRAIPTCVGTTRAP